MLRKAAVPDIPRLMVIEHLTQIAPWSEETFRRFFESHYECLVIEENHQVIAFLMVSSTPTIGCHILNLCVDPSFQRKGYGNELMRHAIASAISDGIDLMYLEVRRSNQPAIALYHQLGFVEIGERKQYYPAKQGREDALILALDLGVARTARG